MMNQDQVKTACDVAVIGAGIGGLTAAALLAKKGLDVAVFEHHTIPGGSVTAFKRKGYLFDAGATMFYGFGREIGMDYQTRVMDELGLSLEMIEMPTHYTLATPDHRFTVWKDKERYLEQLCRAFPADAAGIRSFYEEMGDIYKAVVKSPLRPLEFSPGLLIDFLKNVGGLTMLLRYSRKTTLDVMKKHVNNPRIKQIFDFESLAFSYLDSSECPAVLTSIILHDRHVGGVRYPKGGSQKLPDKLVEGLEKFGGRIHYKQKVEKILVQGGRACGVKLRDGTEVSAKYVVSNAQALDTFNYLVEKGAQSRKLRDRVDSLKITDSFFGVFMGVDASAIPKGGDYFDANFIMIPNYESDWRKALPALVATPSIHDPTVAPAGKHAMHVISAEPYNGWKRDEKYAEKKAKKAEELKKIAERVMPGLKNAIEYECTASPLTYERYLLRNKGTYGPKMTMDQALFNRMKNRTEIKNLFLVGDSSFPGQGVVAVTANGYMCAQLIG